MGNSNRSPLGSIQDQLISTVTHRTAWAYKLDQIVSRLALIALLIYILRAGMQLCAATWPTKPADSSSRIFGQRYTSI